MRELRFRAWVHGEMIYRDDPADIFGNYSNDIMQYTGLKDSKGVEIYEGDILTYVGYSAYGRDKKVSQLTVERDELDGGFNLGRLFEEDHGDIGLSNENITVIGNIYENPTEVT